MNLTQNLDLKKQARRFFLSALEQQKPYSQLHIQRQIRNHIADFTQKKQGLWGAFWPLHNEPDLTELYKDSGQVQWAFPKIKDNYLVFLQRTQSWADGPLGTREPADGEICDLNSIQGFFIPGLGFNRQGVRLGRGRGYYDRTLAHYQGLKVGVCFSLQWGSQDFPTESHDLKMDYVMTENGIEGV